VASFRPVVLNDGRAVELAAVRLIGRISCVTGLCHEACSALRKSPQKGNRDEHFDQREYDRATRIHWTIPTYLLNSSSTRNKLLTACVQSPMGEEEKWQRENNRASECRAPKRSSNSIRNRSRPDPSIDRGSIRIGGSRPTPGHSTAYTRFLRAAILLSSSRFTGHHQ
jgi:hypothetical protein